MSKTETRLSWISIVSPNPDIWQMCGMKICIFVLQLSTEWAKPSGRCRRVFQKLAYLAETEKYGSWVGAVTLTAIKLAIKLCVNQVVCVVEKLAENSAIYEPRVHPCTVSDRVKCAGAKAPRGTANCRY